MNGDRETVARAGNWRRRRTLIEYILANRSKKFISIGLRTYVRATRAARSHSRRSDNRTSDNRRKRSASGRSHDRRRGRRRVGVDSLQDA